MKFFCLDERHVWHKAAIEAARNHGLEGRRIFRGEEVDSEGIGFIRTHADPIILQRNQHDYDLMAQKLTVLQDEDQVRVYENKSMQLAKWAQWMPETWRFTSPDEAVDFVGNTDLKLVSKADVGASSVNVRVLRDREEALDHVRKVFATGVMVDHCSGSAKSVQKGYVILQRFIPHTTTWRVNAVGDARAAFMRYCYKDRPVAQTGNVEPVMRMDAKIESLFDFSNRFFAEAKTKWCAIDVLEDGDSWKLLETSLAWPWPSPGTCNSAQFFGSSRRWIEMFEVMFDEYFRGAWA